MKHLWKFAAVTATALLMACGGGGGGDAPLSVATGSSVGTLDAAGANTVPQAIATPSIVFPGGVPAFGTTASTSLNISNLPLTQPPSFTITSGGSTASGDITFGTNAAGSCTFNVRTSNFPAGSQLAAGAAPTVSPCQVTLATTGVPANGTPTTVNVTLTLGTVTSLPYKQIVVIIPNGTVLINSLVITLTKLGFVTGA